MRALIEKAYEHMEENKMDRNLATSMFLTVDGNELDNTQDYSNVRWATVRNCTWDKLPDKFPRTIKWLKLEDCPAITEIPKNFLSKLTTLENFTIDHCHALLTICGKLPTTLKTLSIPKCTTLTELPELPQTLEFLDLRGCSALLTLPNLTNQLKTIWLEGCTSLKQTPELLQQLQNLEKNGCQVTLPAHFVFPEEIKTAKNILSNIIAKYKETTPLGAPRTSQLFDRFLNEGLEQRGGASEIANYVFPLLEMLTKHPNHLGWIEKIAADFLDACVDQPVAGFSEICAWADVASKSSIEDKINASRQIIAKHRLNELASKMIEGFKAKSTTPGKYEAYEVDIANMLLHEIHQQLVASGMKPWSGIPKSILFAKEVEDLISKDGIGTDITEAIRVAVAEVQEINSRPAKNIALTLQSSEIWAEVAFPDKFKEIEEKYMTAENNLNAAYDSVVDEKILLNRKNKLKELQAGRAQEIEKLTDDYLQNTEAKSRTHLNTQNVATCSSNNNAFPPTPESKQNSAIKTAKDRLESIIKGYIKEYDIDTKYTTKLFIEFLNEATKRGATDLQILQATDPFLKILKTEPSHLEWVNNIAYHYCSGNISKPVSGFAEICFWVTMANDKSTIADKIETARQAIIKRELSELADSIINRHEQTLGEDPSLLPYQMVLEEIMPCKIYDLLGIKGIELPEIPAINVSEATLNSVVNEEDIEEAINIVTTIKSQPTEKIANILLLHPFLTVWGRAVFADKLTELEGKFFAENKLSDRFPVTEEKGNAQLRKLYMKACTELLHDYLFKQTTDIIKNNTLAALCYKTEEKPLKKRKTNSSDATCEELQETSSFASTGAPTSQDVSQMDTEMQDAASNSPPREQAGTTTATAGTSWQEKGEARNRSKFGGRE